MTALKAYIAASFVAAIIAGAGGLYLAGKSHQRDKTELENATDHIETRERIDNATAPVDGCAWLDRLHGTCSE